MRYTAVLNGCSDNFITQAQEINGFLSCNPAGNMEGSSIIFYCDTNRKDELVKHSPTSRTVMVKVSRYQPENILDILKTMELNKSSDMYIFSGDYSGSELSVRFACRMSGSSLVGVNSITPEEGGILCGKAVYSNHMQGKFLLKKKPFCISIAKGCTDKKPVSVTDHYISEMDMTGLSMDTFIKSFEYTRENAVSGLDSSKFLIVAGRGLRKKENMDNLIGIAKEIGAEVGVSRPAAMSAWAPMNRLVGVSGIMTKPELCIAVGVSGAAALFAGIEKSGYIIAINTDENSAMVKNADVAVIDDYKCILEELVKLIKASDQR